MRLYSCSIAIITPPILGKESFELSDYKLYKQQIVGLVRFLRERVPFIILATSHERIAPKRPSRFMMWINLFYKITRKREKLDKNLLPINCQRNRCIKEVAHEEGVELLDIAERMQQTRYLRADFIHYERKSDPYYARLLKEKLEQCISL